MVRGIHTRKRSRAPGSSGRNFKRRRTVPRRTGRKTTNFTTQKGSGSGLTYRARKVRPAAYRKLLWDSSTLKTKYRTIQSVSGAITTSVNSNLMTTVVNSAVNFGLGPFWASSGGAISPDAINPLPAITGDIILRGGMIGLRLNNLVDTVAANSGTIQCMVYLVRTSRAFNAAVIPATVSVGWDPSYVQDFATTVGKIVYRKTFLLRDADTANVEYRLKTSRIDEGDYTLFRNQLVWVILIGGADALAKSVNYNLYYNMSFCGDAQ